MLDYVNTGKRGHTRHVKQRMIESGDSPVLTSKNDIITFINGSISGEIEQGVKAYGKVGDRLAGAVLQVSDGKIDISGKYMELSAEKLRHAYTEHTKAKMPGDIPLTDDHFLNLPEYVDSFDDIIHATADGKYGVKIQLGKIINGYVIITEIVSSERNSLHPINAWCVSADKHASSYKKTGASHPGGNSTGGDPGLYPATGRADFAANAQLSPYRLDAPVSNNSILKQPGAVKGLELEPMLRRMRGEIDERLEQLPPVAQATSGKTASGKPPRPCGALGPPRPLRGHPSKEGNLGKWAGLCG